jgi:uncharacterized membrane protein YfcA
MLLFWQFVFILLLVAVAAGAVGSLAGLGGGLIIVPVLSIFFPQIPFVYAVGASAVSVLATSATTGATYVHDRLTDLRIGLFLMIATVPGALVGAAVTILLQQYRLVPILLILLGAILLATLPGSLRRHGEEVPENVVPDARSRRLKLHGSYFDQFLHREIEYHARDTTSALGVMFTAGLVSGMFGIGSGVLKVLALERALRLPMKVATATSNFMIGVTVAAGAGVLLTAGYINPALVIPVAIGTTIGSYGGSLLLPRLSNAFVRWFFVPVLVALSLEVIVRGSSALLAGAGL